MIVLLDGPIVSSANVRACRYTKMCLYVCISSACSLAGQQADIASQPLPVQVQSV